MRRSLLILNLFLIFFVIWSQHASANFKLGAQLGYGGVNYSKPGEQNQTINKQAKEWSTRLSASYTYNDLFFTGLYRGGQSLEGNQIKQDLAQFSTNYSVLEEDILRIYAGLGYQFLNSNLEHPDGGKNLALRTNSFLGQVIITFDIMEKLEAVTAISIAPFLNFKMDGEDGSGHSFNYSLDFNYDFKEEYGLRLALVGGSYGVDDLQIKTSYAGANLGLTWRF